MKRILTVITVAAVLAGCQKYEYNPSMAAKINGASFSANGKARVYAQGDTSTHDPQLAVITGKSDTYTPGTSFMPMIVLVAPNVEGKYIIDTNNKAVYKTMVYTAATGNTGTIAISGEINILSINKGRIEGNFTLTCADGTTITNGQYVCEQDYY